MLIQHMMSRLIDMSKYLNEVALTPAEMLDVYAALYADEKTSLLKIG